MNEGRGGLSISKIFLLVLLLFNTLLIVQYLRLSGISKKSNKIQALNSDTFVELPERRRNIVDRNGVLIAGIDERNELFFDPRVVRKLYSPKEAYDIMTGDYGVSEREALEALRKFNDDSKYISVTFGLAPFPELNRDAEPGTGLDSNRHYKSHDGFYLKKRYLRSYPDYKLSRPWLGFSDKYSDGHEGFELYYNRILKRGNYKIDALVDARRRIVRLGETNIPDFVAVTTIDMSVQKIAQEVVEKYLDKFNCSYTGAIVMDTTNGDIIAFATSRGSYDVANPLCVDSYEAGSILKPFTVLCALEGGYFSPDYIIECKGEKLFRGRKIECHKPHGTIKSSDILTYSCNIGMVELALKIPHEVLRDFLVSNFFIARKTLVDLPFESSGYITPSDEWNFYTQSSIPLGYELRTTALQILASYATISNGGFNVTPHFLKELRDYDGNILYKREVVKSHTGIKGKNIDMIKSMLSDVVKKGTGRYYSYNGLEYGGKTGTAHIYDRASGSYSNEYRSSFIALLPEESGLLVYAILHRPKPQYFASLTAVPMVSEILERLDRELRYFKGDVHGSE